MFYFLQGSTPEPAGFTAGNDKVYINRIASASEGGNRVLELPIQKHFFNNTSSQESLVKVTVSPGNQNFEEALLMSKGLAKEGLASAGGTPKKLSDLALFIWLNDSRMVGIQKIAEPFRLLSIWSTGQSNTGDWIF